MLAPHYIAMPAMINPIRAESAQLERLRQTTCSSEKLILASFHFCCSVFGRVRCLYSFRTTGFAGDCAIGELLVFREILAVKQQPDTDRDVLIFDCCRSG